MSLWRLESFLTCFKVHGGSNLVVSCVFYCPFLISSPIIYYSVKHKHPIEDIDHIKPHFSIYFKMMCLLLELSQCLNLAPHSTNPLLVFFFSLMIPHVTLRYVTPQPMLSTEVDWVLSHSIRYCES